MSLQESKLKVEKLCTGLSCVCSSSPIEDSQLTMETVTHEDVRGTHDLIEGPPMIYDHEKHLDEHVCA